MLLSALPTLALGLFSLLAGPTTALPEPAATPAAAKKCPSPFAVYLGTGNDAAKRQWYFHEIEVGRTTRLGLDAGTAYVLKGSALEVAAEPGRRLYTFGDSDALIAATDALKAERGPEWTANLRNVTATIDKNCKLRLRYANRKFLARVGTPYVYLSNDPKLGSIQFGDVATAKNGPFEETGDTTAADAAAAAA